MPYYSLLVVAENKILSDAAGSCEEALAKFGVELGIQLTLVDQGCVALYLLDEWTDGPHWINPHIPVFAISN